MNKQFSSRTGSRGIEWADFTHNVTAGCKHGCRWTMPDGSEAICYAEALAEHGLAKRWYPDGFDHHYWHPSKLGTMQQQERPSLIFIDSMSDLFGHWVPDEHIRAVLGDVRNAKQHIAQVLTKNAPRILEYVDELPENLWVGISSPPDAMWGHALSPLQQHKMLERQLEVLRTVQKRRPELITFMSMEPLSWDFSQSLGETCPLKWAIIGAATNGSKKYQPDPEHVTKVLKVLDKHHVPVFFKGNLVWHPWREDFPPLMHAALLQRRYQASIHGWTISRYLPKGWTEKDLLEFASL